MKQLFTQKTLNPIGLVLVKRALKCRQPVEAGLWYYWEQDTFNITSRLTHRNDGRCKQDVDNSTERSILITPYNTAVSIASFSLCTIHTSYSDIYVCRCHIQENSTPRTVHWVIPFWIKFTSVSARYSLDSRSRIKVHTDERTQVHSARFSLTVTHPTAKRSRRCLTSVNVPLI